MYSISYKNIGRLNGQDIYLFRITNPAGSYIELLNYGATLVSVVVPDMKNNFQNVILSYKDIEGYFSDTCYIGSTVGRVANRISGAQFVLDGKTYKLDKNDGENCNHGGYIGFNRKIFDYQIDKESVTFFGESYDKESGFPGNIHFSVTYSFLKNNTLQIEYGAVSDKNTPMSLTNHAYFNLSSGKEDGLSHELRVLAENYLEMNDKFLPTGIIKSVAGTAFDFREYTRIDKLMPLKSEILKGYNTYFIGSDQPSSRLKKLASLRNFESGRMMEVYSTMPGVQFYTGDYLNGKHSPFEGVCLEAQYFPDFPNHFNFQGCTIGPDKKFEEKIQYVFSNIDEKKQHEYKL